MLEFTFSYTGRFDSPEFFDLREAAETLEKPISAPVLVGCLEFIIDQLKQVNNESKTHELPRRIIERKLSQWQSDADPKSLIDLYLKHGLLLTFNALDGKEFLRSPEVENAVKKMADNSAKRSHAARTRWDKEKAVADGKERPTQYQPTFKNLKVEKPPQTSPARPTVPTDQRHVPQGLYTLMHKNDHLSQDE